MTSPTVSVITPTYNRTTFLREAIESVLAQTYPHWEMIIVDDDSTDNTRQVVEEYNRHDPRIRYVHQPHTGNTATGRNFAVSMAQGELLAMLDDDDLWLPEKLKKQVACFERDPALGLVYAKCAMHYQGTPEGVWPPRDYPRTFRSLFWVNSVPCMTAVVRKHCFERVDGFDKSFLSCADYDLWLRIAQRYRMDWVPEVLAIYRKHDSNLSRGRDGKSNEGVYLDHFKLIEKVPVSRTLGISRRDKDRRIAEDRIGLAKLYRRLGADAKAAGQFARALRLDPFVGLKFWDAETERWRFTAPYRLLKPYVELMQCAWAHYIQRLLKPTAPEAS